MDIEELEKIMREHGAVLRAIPYKTHEVYELYNRDVLPDGRIEYLEQYGREMLVVERVPENAGNFLIESAKSTIGTITFHNRPYKTIVEAVDALVNGDIKSPNRIAQKK